MQGLLYSKVGTTYTAALVRDQIPTCSVVLTGPPCSAVMRVLHQPHQASAAPHCDDSCLWLRCFALCAALQTGAGHLRQHTSWQVQWHASEELKPTCRQQSGHSISLVMKLSAGYTTRPQNTRQ